MPSKRHIAEQFDLVEPDEIQPQTYRITFDVTGTDAATLAQVIGAFKQGNFNPNLSPAQAVKMLFRVGLQEWLAGRRAGK